MRVGQRQVIRASDDSATREERGGRASLAEIVLGSGKMFPAKDSRPRLAGRPGQGAAAEKMQMQMINGLAGVRPAIDGDAVAAFKS